MLGHDTVLDIARELHVDSMFVREALRRHRDSAEMPPLPPLLMTHVAPARRGGAGQGCLLVVLLLAGLLGGLFMAGRLAVPRPRSIEGEVIRRSVGNGAVRLER